MVSKPKCVKDCERVDLLQEEAIQKLKSANSILSKATVLVIKNLETLRVQLVKHV